MSTGKGEGDRSEVETSAISLSPIRPEGKGMMEGMRMPQSGTRQSFKNFIAEPDIIQNLYLANASVH